jgi:predicted nucleotidyltransferase
MPLSSTLYITAARVVARVLAAPGVRSVFIRRSVATGDAVFPLSDLDLSLVVGEIGGAGMADLYRRLRIAGILFPRLGEVQVTTPEELRDMAESDPYRAYLDGRSAITIFGEQPHIPQFALSPTAVARRLVFWLDHYLPLAVRRGRHGDQRKFVFEMWNALSVLQGRWPVPQLSRRTIQELWNNGGFEVGAPPFVQCCRFAEQAHALLGCTAPEIDRTILLKSPRPILLLPRADSAWPPEAYRPGVRVFTPPALNLFMATQDPLLWLDVEVQLRELGFEMPSRGSWCAACLRLAGGERLRRPGFSERGPGQYARRLVQLETVIAWIEKGQVGEPSPTPERSAPQSVSTYYREQFDQLAKEAARLRPRARAL